jgi:prolyl oligopeptidase
VIKRFSLLCVSVTASLVLLNGCHRRPEQQPQVHASAEPKKAVAATNEYHGVTVADPFRWLENGVDPAVQQWTAQQNQRARAYLDGLADRPLIADRLTRLMTRTAADYSSLSWRRGRLFLLKFQPPAEQPVLITLTSWTNLNSERVLLDPNKLNPKGTTTIDWFVPSLDGRLVAVSLSDSGTEEGTLHLYRTADAGPEPDVIPRVQAATAGGSVAWNSDSSGFYYTRYPRPDERPKEDVNFYQQVYFHRLGTPVEQDTYEFGKDFPRIAEIELKSSPDGRYIAASVANGDGGEYAHYLREPAGMWREVAAFENEIKQVEFGRDPLYIEWGKDDALYLLSRLGAANGEILRMGMEEHSLTNATVVVAESKDVIADFKPAASGLCLVFQKGGPSKFGYLDYFDGTIRQVEDRTPTAIGQVLVTQGDQVLFRTETYTEPYEWLQYNPSRNKDRVESTALGDRSPVSFADVQVVREKVKSKDGTLIPLNIIRKKGTRLNGENPTILRGYGGFGISQAPGFDVSRRFWLDQGGVFAIANLRGGGEFGESWHRAGSLTNKQNVFEDFWACAEFLVRSNYTTAAKLAIEGRSNGGLLMGAALTQHPDAFRAVVSHVGLYDMLRAELDPNGSFNVTEYGTVKDPEQFNALYGYSPYHHVDDRAEYPAILMLTGENDGRVNPAHSRKMVARLQSPGHSPHPILLRTSSGGHGLGTALSERVEQLSDVYAFLCAQLGIYFSQIDRGPWSGGVSPDSAIVKGKLLREGLSARLLVSQSSSLAQPVYVGPSVAETNHGDVVQFALNHLQPDTQYYCGFEVNGRLEPAKTLEFRTFPPPGPASFSIAFASCARTGSTSDVFDRIRENRPLFYMNTGDFHYLDIQTNSRPRFRDAYDTVLASPQQAELFRHIPFVYLWDDHDYGGNNSNRKATVHEAASLTYDEYVPHYPLPLAFTGRGGGPICQSFSVGRVKFILTDLRSARDDIRKKDDAAKSMMGASQKEWFKQQLLAANGKYPLICWVSSVPWIGTAGTNVYHAVKTNQYGYIHHSQLLGDGNSRTNRGIGPAVEDWWSVFSTERREIADFIKQNHIRGVCILHGDSHMLAADDGSHSDYATGGGAPLPVMCAAPLDQEASLKGGPYSQGVYRLRAGEGCFGWLTITDTGDRIDVAYSGRNNKNLEMISLKFSVPAQPAAAGQ